MASKTKTGVVPAPASKTSPGTPKVSKPRVKSDPNSPSLVQSSRLSAERSPRTSISKPAPDRRSSPKVPTPPEKLQSRVAKGTELQSQLSQVQEDLKKAKEQIASLEKEKSQAIEELGEAKKSADETNQKLSEALAAQKQADDNSEVERFRTIELEQVGFEATQRREEQWKKELESLKNQHDLDKAELERMNRELAQALSHADQVNKTSELNVEKVDILSSELMRLKALLDSKCEKESIQSSEIASKLKSEMDVLKEELNKARNFERELIERDASIKRLKVDLEVTKTAESCAHGLAEELKAKVGELEIQVGELKKSERCASESLETATRQLKESSDSLNAARSELGGLKEKLGLLEMANGRQRDDLEESQSKLDRAKEEASEMAEMIDWLKSELETVKEERVRALENEKLAASSMQNLLKEKNKLVIELKSSREEEEKSKKAMESLASALHEVSTEARDLKEKLFSSGHGDYEHYEMQIEDLKLVIKATNEKYENHLDDAKHQIDVLTCAVEHTKDEFEYSKSQWEEKEMSFLSQVKKSEEELSSMQREINRLANLLRRSEEDARAAQDEEVELRDSLKEVEDEVVYLQETLKDTKNESMKLKESLMDKETELQIIVQENEELRERDIDSLKKIEELSKLLKDAKAEKQTDENGEITDSEKDYDLLPKVVEFSVENGHRSGEEKSKTAISTPETENSGDESQREDSSKDDDTVINHVENRNGKSEEETEERKHDESVEVEFKMWESCQIDKKEALLEKNSGNGLLEEEEDSKLDCSESFECRNRLSSGENMEEEANLITKEQQLKKKKPFMRKFGNLLKKKGATNVK